MPSVLEELAFMHGKSAVDPSILPMKHGAAG
jgi:hypothetical protein